VLGRDDPPNLAELQVREDERVKLLAEMEKVSAVNRDSRVFALVISVCAALAVIVPILAGLAGLSVRIFRYAAGW